MTDTVDTCEDLVDIMKENRQMVHEMTARLEKSMDGEEMTEHRIYEPEFIKECFLELLEDPEFRAKLKADLRTDPEIINTIRNSG